MVERQETNSNDNFSELCEKYLASLMPYWHPVALSSELDARKPVRVTLLERPLAICRLDGAATAVEDVCRHFQARLSDGGVEEVSCAGQRRQILRCHYHGWAYGADGACVQIPQLADGQTIPAAARVSSFPTFEKHGLVWVALQSPRFPIPEFPEDLDEDFLSTQSCYSDPWDCSLHRMVLSALDDYHFPWLHEGVLGSRDRVAPPIRKIRRDSRTLVSSFTQIQPANVTNSVGCNLECVGVDYEMRVDMPNVIRLVKSNQQQGTYVVCFYPMPITPRKTGLFWRVIRNYDKSPGDEDRIIAMERFIQGQDKIHVSAQEPWRSAPLPIKGADDALVEYLRWLKELDIPTGL